MLQTDRMQKNDPQPEGRFEALPRHFRFGVYISLDSRGKWMSRCFTPAWHRWFPSFVLRVPHFLSGGLQIDFAHHLLVPVVSHAPSTTLQIPKLLKL